MSTEVIIEKYYDRAMALGDEYETNWLKNASQGDDPNLTCVFASGFYAGVEASGAPELLAALKPFAALLLGDLSEVGGGTLIAPTVNVQMIKDAIAAISKATTTPQ